MWNIDVLSFIAGIILLFIALIGGGFKIKEIEMPRVSAIFRFLSAVAGIIFIWVGISIHSNVPGEKKTDIPKTEIEETKKVYCPQCKVWNFLFIEQGVQYEALLVFNPTNGFGKMRVKYFLNNRNILIQEEMNQVSSDQGQYLAGKNPFDTETFQPISTYSPDNLMMDNNIIKVFDQSGYYDAKMIPINNVEAIIRVFGFSNADLDF